MNRGIVACLMSLAGAVAGAFIGLGIYRWLWGQGFDAMVLPGAALGLGAHLASPRRSFARGVVLGVVALALGIVTEWWHAPFQADESFPYFLQHLLDLRPGTLVMIGLGGVFAFWWGRDRSPWFGRDVRLTQPIKVEARVQGDEDRAS